MDDYDTEKSQQCYKFPGIREFLKRYTLHSTKRQHDRNRRRHLSSNYKVKPADDSKPNHHLFHHHHSFKATYDKNQDANHLNGVEDVEHEHEHEHGLEKWSRKHKSHNNSYYEHHHHHHYNSCFKAIISLNKKKKVPSRVSSFDPSKTQTMEMEPLEVEKNLLKSKSFQATSLERSKSLNNSRKEGMNTRSFSNTRASSMMNRTTSAGSTSRTTTTPFNRTASVGRSASDVAAAKVRRSQLSKSGPLIMFSNSSGMLKPPAIEKQLECTLEELYHGCVKHVHVSRDVYTFSGQKIQEEEVQTVNIKPGWKTGTKITFPGTANDERPGEYVGDIVFVVTEKQHPLYRRVEDDLELEIEIPLVDALTGSKLAIPLLGNKIMSINIDDIVYPGYQKTFVGQGMPNQKDPLLKGDLTVTFLVLFPDNLTDEQRSQIFQLLST